MTRPNRKKPKEKLGRSQRTNHLKAMALKKVAQQAWNLNQPYKTIALLTEAVRREPTNHEILFNLAVAHGRQRNYEKAEQYLARVMELAPRKAAIYRRVAQTYVTIERRERAIECYRRSLELNRDTSATLPTLLELAQVYERFHQLDDARAVVDEALRARPCQRRRSTPARDSRSPLRRDRPGRSRFTGPRDQLCVQAACRRPGFVRTRSAP